MGFGVNPEPWRGAGAGPGGVTSEALHVHLHGTPAAPSVLGICLTTPFPPTPARPQTPDGGVTANWASMCLGWQWALVALRLWSHGPSPAPSPPPSSIPPHRHPPPPGLSEGRVEAGGPAGASGHRQSSPFPLLTPLGRCLGDEAELSQWGRLAAGGSPATLSLSQGNYRRGGNGRG